MSEINHGVDPLGEQVRRLVREAMREAQQEEDERRRLALASIMAAEAPMRLVLRAAPRVNHGAPDLLAIDEFDALSLEEARGVLRAARRVDHGAPYLLASEDFGSWVAGYRTEGRVERGGGSSLALTWIDWTGELDVALLLDGGAALALADLGPGVRPISAAALLSKLASEGRRVRAIGALENRVAQWLAEWLAEEEAAAGESGERPISLVTRAA